MIKIFRWVSVLLFVALSGCAPPDGEPTVLTYFNYCFGRSLGQVIVKSSSKEDMQHILNLETRSKIPRRAIFIKDGKVFVLAQVVTTWFDNTATTINMPEDEIKKYMSEQNFSCM